MRRDFPQPIDPGVFVGGVGLASADVDLAGDVLVDEGLLVLFQQPDPPLPQPDGLADAPVGPVEEADDGGLFGEGREG